MDVKAAVAVAAGKVEVTSMHDITSAHGVVAAGSLRTSAIAVRNTA
jgi:hypothetical protein